MIILPNGAGELTGDALITQGVFQATGAVYYVHAPTGSGAASGINRARPFNTLSTAQIAASDGDTIVLMDGHFEDLSGGMTISKRLTIVAGGTSSGQPTVYFQASAAIVLFTITAAGVQFRNIKFKASTVANSNAHVSCNVANLSVIGCRFERDGNDTGAGISLGAAASSFRCRNTTFVSTATAATPVPGPGILVSGAASDPTVEGCVFDGGTYGFINGYAYSETAAPTRRRGESISMLRGADALFHASAAESYWQQTTSSSDARIAI